MRLCVLATNENVEAVRASGLTNIPEFVGQKLLTIPVSATGELPATHWFCSFSVTKEFYERIVALQKLSEMELNDTKTFLEARGLKVIL